MRESVLIPNFLKVGTTVARLLANLLCSVHLCHPNAVYLILECMLAAQTLRAV